MGPLLPRDPLPGLLYRSISCLCATWTFWSVPVPSCLSALYLQFYSKLPMGEKLTGESPHQSSVPVFSARPASYHPPTLGQGVAPLGNVPYPAHSQFSSRGRGCSELGSRARLPSALFLAATFPSCTMPLNLSMLQNYYLLKGANDSTHLIQFS